MSDPIDVLDEAIDGVDRLRRNTISKGTSRQVTGGDERALVKATALAWVKKQRAALGKNGSSAHLDAADKGFQELLEFSDRNITRDKYKKHLSALRKELVALRTDVIANPAIVAPAPTAAAPPSWSALVPDPQMQAILTRRWHETTRCLGAEANLAATVMMGALLEALLLARVNHLSDKSKLFKTSAAPKDKTGKPVPLGEWTLKHYIDVAHEMKWIRQAARDVGIVMRDYRNYIHPDKERRHGVEINHDDAQMFWTIFQSLATQILKSI